MKPLLYFLVPLSAILLGGCVVINVSTHEAGPNSASDQPAMGHSSAEDLAEQVVNRPGLFNVDFGPWKGAESEQSGPAVKGQKGDYWNVVGRPFQDAHTESGLKWANRRLCPIKVEMRNLGGGWYWSGKLGLASPMLNDFNYPANNKGGDSHVILHGVPPSTYDLFIYGHGLSTNYYGDYAVSVGEKSYGRRTTYAPDNKGQDTQWIENRQYVLFRNLRIKTGESVEIHIRPGIAPEEPAGRVPSDAMIAGLQLVPR